MLVQYGACVFLLESVNIHQMDHYVKFLKSQKIICANCAGMQVFNYSIYVITIKN